MVDEPLLLLTERVELDRLDVAGATLRTDDEFPLCCETLRVELEVLLPVLTLRLELDPATLRLELDPATLRLELLPATLRLAEVPATLRPSELPETDLDATPEVVLTVRLALEPNAGRLVVLRLRFLSHPPLFILRLGV